MRNFIKYHWFGLLISLMVGAFMIEFFLVFFAPHQDMENRGFVPCTEEMAQRVEQCNRRYGCVLKAVIGNTLCDSGVIADGLIDWIKGRQPRPWSNYLFEPTYPDEEIDDELSEYYQKNPDIIEQMDELKRKNYELEKENNEE